MKKQILTSAILLFTLSFAMTSCSKDDDEATPTTVTVDSSKPDGALTIERQGDLTAENGTPTMGTVALGKDTKGINFLHFASNFETQLATGTVSVYLSTSDTFTADPMNGNPDLMLIGAIQGNGEQYFKLDAAVPSNFTHVILWCNTASIPFGNGALN